jgi:hypothetical protein
VDRGARASVPHRPDVAVAAAPHAPQIAGRAACPSKAPQGLGPTSRFLGAAMFLPRIYEEDLP